MTAWGMCLDNTVERPQEKVIRPRSDSILHLTKIALEPDFPSGIGPTKVYLIINDQKFMIGLLGLNKMTEALNIKIDSSVKIFKEGPSLVYVTGYEERIR